MSRHSAQTSKERHFCHKFLSRTSFTESGPDDPLPTIPYRLLAPLAFVGLVDALCYMVTAPSLVFYVLDNGGSYRSYGWIVAAFSLSSFLFKPVLGYWCDQCHTFVRPYLVSLYVAAAGGLLYFGASLTSQPNHAMVLLFAGRFLGGMGAANSTLGFTYVAQHVCGGDDSSGKTRLLTQATAVLSMVRVIGMTTAPALSLVFHHLQGTLPFGFSSSSSSSSWTVWVRVTPLNVVGLFMAMANLLAVLVIDVFLVEPKGPISRLSMSKDAAKATVNEEIADENYDVEKTSWCNQFDNVSDQETIPTKDEETKERGFGTYLLFLSLMVPVLSIFQLNANFQLLETALAPRRPMTFWV